ncbi:glycosyltransferase family 4 protein [Apibacter sp. HY039]|uniref:glycosyltransferase family 4 protein n=1 Tax=Apibacter sp. HY039 TaxID=2501476 RepID=UPI000FEB6A19|nr:glycosyltransferase family 4 protein [Apibacter sp. HY039]
MNNTKDFGVNLTGFFKAEIGFGQAIRDNLKALNQVGIKAEAVNFNLNLKDRLNDSSIELSEDNKYPVNIVHVNMDTTWEFLKEKSPSFYKDKYNIGFWAWEMEDFPEKYCENFSFYDEIWTCSKYCLDSISLKSPIPVINIPHPIDINSLKINESYDSELKSDTYKFLFIFDYNSLILRKNVMAVIDAFEKAFGTENEKVSLILKASIPSHHPEDKNRIVKRIENFKNIFYKEEMLRREDLLSLINQSDCYVSLHRSEGFGLTIAEAMALGKPVIATGYSGNMEFMNINNSYPVKYELTELKKDIGPLLKGNFWSEPSVDHAAELMQFVYENQEQAKLVGLRAQEDIKNRFSLEVIGTKMKKRLEVIEESIIPFKNTEEVKQNLTYIKTENIFLKQRVHYLERTVYNKLRKSINKFFSKLKGEN